MITSEEGTFWDQRYRTEGAIWGEQPSLSAQELCWRLPPQSHVLEIGFGYGRDLDLLCAAGHHVWGVELSDEGCRLARERTRKHGTNPPQILQGRFEDLAIPEDGFDAVLSHRLAHLLITREAIAQHVRKIRTVLKQDGLLSLGARNLRDLNPEVMIPVEPGIYEYASRPGHRIRYWDEVTFRKHFSEDFDVLDLISTEEIESRANPAPCYLTILVGRKRAEKTWRNNGRADPTSNQRKPCTLT